MLSFLYILGSGLHMMQENFTPSPSSTSSLHFGPPKVSRKQKSLGLLCEKFMSRFPESVPEGEKCEIPLDDLAKQMSTERRRIYDIVNVLEAVQMMTKVRFLENYYKLNLRSFWDGHKTKSSSTFCGLFRKPELYLDHQIQEPISKILNVLEVVQMMTK